MYLLLLVFSAYALDFFFSYNNCRHFSSLKLRYGYWYYWLRMLYKWFWYSGIIKIFGFIENCMELYVANHNLCKFSGYNLHLPWELMKVCCKYEHRVWNMLWLLSPNIRCSRRENWIPVYLSELVFFVAFIFSRLKQHLKKVKNSWIFSLFYVLDIYGSFRTFGDLILDFIERR